MHLDLQQRLKGNQFLGLAGCHHDYIPHFVSIAGPLTDLLRKERPTKVDWGEAQQKAFASLKHSLTGTPILNVPGFVTKKSLSCRQMHLRIKKKQQQNVGNGKNGLAIWRLAPFPRNLALIHLTVVTKRVLRTDDNDGRRDERRTPAQRH